MLNFISKCFVFFPIILLSSGQDTAIIDVSPGPRIEFKPIKELPSTIPTCKESDRNVNECIKSAFQQMMPRLKNGIEELSIPPLDPFVIEKSRYQYAQGPVQGRVALKNVHVYGLSGAIIEAVNFKTSKNKVNLRIITRIPSIFVEGTYKGDVKINELKFSPKGYFNVSITDVVMKAAPEGELYEREDHTYLRLKKFNAIPEIGDMKIFATGLFEDPTLNSLVLDFANQYWRQIHQAMLPEARARWDPIMLNSANEFFAALPFDFLLTKD